MLCKVCKPHIVERDQMSINYLLNSDMDITPYIKYLVAHFIQKCMVYALNRSLLQVQFIVPYVTQYVCNVRAGTILCLRRGAV
jgi:hypothetical protein